MNNQGMKKIKLAPPQHLTGRTEAQNTAPPIRKTTTVVELD
jgi:hypothetical protein